MTYRFKLPTRMNLLFLVAFTVSLLLSTWLSLRESVINADAVCYITSAKMVGTDGLRAAMKLCPQAGWPFYSAMIYGFSQFTHLSLTAAAYVMDAFFSLISVGSFILIAKELGGSLRVLWLAALTILLSHQFNSVREYIVRDHGYWAFYLASMLFLLRYARRPRLKLALAYNLCLMIATSFRIEGLAFLVLLPFVTWFQKRYSFRQRARNFFLLYSPLIAIGMVVATWLLMHPLQSLDKLGNLYRWFLQFQSSAGIIVERFHAAKLELRHSILAGEAVDQAGMVIVSASIAFYILNVVENLSWIYTLLCLYAFRSRTIIFRSTAPIILYWYIGINILITTVFLGEHLFLSKRYLIALSLVLMLWVPFALNDIIRKWPSARHRIILGIVAFLILVSSIGGIVDFGYSKQYVRDAGNWISANIPAEASVYSNDIQLMYYSDHYGNDIFKDAVKYDTLKTLDHGHWKDYDYLALRIGKKDMEEVKPLLKQLPSEPVGIFKNKRGDRVVIYKIARGGASS